MAVARLTRPDVVVVGAGFAGLSAAVRLARGGARVLVLEARARLGGRATAFPDRETGDIVDNGQHILVGCYRETFAFLAEIGARDDVRLQPQLAVTMIDRAGRRTRLSCPPLPAPLHLLAGLMDWDALSARDKWAALRMRGPLAVARRERRPGATLKAASPGETVESWLVRNGQTPTLRELLWEPLALAALNQPADRAAAPPFARVLAEMFGDDSRDAAIGLPLRPLDRLYAEPARDYVERRGGQVRTGATARVRVDGDILLGVDADGERVSAGAVIAAVPWFALPDLFAPPAPALEQTLEAARRTAASPIVSVNLWLDGFVADEPFVGLPGRTMQWLFDKRHLLGPASYVSLVASGAESVARRTNDDLVAAALTELVEALPEARSARLRRATVVREPRATFSLAPGQPARPRTETAVRGLLLAGDWIDTGLPATIEGAVRSGHQAADRIGE
jgi:hydroxysqualene dehydroxylase